MRVAAIYDIHANLPALRAVLADVKRTGVDRVVVGGDVVPGPMPKESIAALLDLEVPVDFIRGNGEAEILAILTDGSPSDSVPPEHRDALIWVAGELTPAQGKLLGEWPLTHRLEVPGIGSVLFCHATPRSDTEVFTGVTPEDHIGPVFESVEADLVVCGHTHMQFDRHIGGLRVVNAGSVGMPWGSPSAYWALLGPEVELRHTSYDLAAAAKRIRLTAFPSAATFASDYVLDPPSEADMIALYERSSLT